MSSSMSPTSPTSQTLSSSAKMSLPALKADLQKAVVARGNPYTQKTALIVYWQDDNTDASKDAESLKITLTDCFDIPPKIFVIKRTDVTPAWSLRGEINYLITKLHAPTKGRHQSLFIFAYMGHGSLDVNNKLTFVSESGKRISWTEVHASLFATSESLEHVDVLGFLDCCYAGATRTQSTRTTQILAACGAREQARSRTDAISFTQRFGRAARALRVPGTTVVTTAALFQELQREKPNNAPDPKFANLGGVEPIALPFKKMSASAPASPSRLPISSRPKNDRDKHVLVKLTLDGRSHDVTRDFKEVIAALPGNFKVEIVDAFETDASALVLVRMTWEAWARFTALVNLEPIGTIIGPSLIERGPSLHQVPMLGENIPPRVKGKRGVE